MAVPDFLRKVNNGVSGGHLSAKRTLIKVRESSIGFVVDKMYKIVAVNVLLVLLKKMLSQRNQKLYNVSTPWKQSVIDKASATMKTRYDQRSNSNGFEESVLVWLHNSTRRKETSHILLAKWKGF